MRAAVLALVTAIPCGQPTRAAPPPAPQPAPAAPALQITDEEFKTLVLRGSSPVCGTRGPDEIARDAERHTRLSREWPRVQAVIVRLVDEDSCPPHVLLWAVNRPLPENHVPLRDALRRWRERLDWPGRGPAVTSGDECALARLHKRVAAPSNYHPQWDLVNTLMREQWDAPRPADECGLGRSTGRTPPARAQLRSASEVSRWEIWDKNTGALFVYFARFGDASDLAWMERTWMTLSCSGGRYYEEHLEHLRDRLRVN